MTESFLNLNKYRCKKPCIHLFNKLKLGIFWKKISVKRTFLSYALILLVYLILNTLCYGMGMQLNGTTLASYMQALCSIPSAEKNAKKQTNKKPPKFRKSV